MDLKNDRENEIYQDGLNNGMLIATEGFLIKIAEEKVKDIEENQKWVLLEDHRLGKKNKMFNIKKIINTMVKVKIDNTIKVVNIAEIPMISRRATEKELNYLAHRFDKKR